MTDRETIRKAFAAARKAGVKARMSFMCCQTCAWYEFEKDGHKDGDPVVFFHQQSAEAFDKDGNLHRTLHIYHSGYGANVLVAALTALGMKVKWDGDEARAVQVQP